MSVQEEMRWTRVQLVVNAQGWNLRVAPCALRLTTDRCPPFQLGPMTPAEPLEQPRRS